MDKNNPSVYNKNTKYFLKKKIELGDSSKGTIYRSQHTNQQKVNLGGHRS